MDDYLAAAGVDQANLATDTPDLPPTEILIDSFHANDPAAPAPDQMAQDASLDLIPPDLLDTQLQDDPQHHGV
jgi:hypothetical protein